jgi:SAM-dependent methyltransferase
METADLNLATPQARAAAAYNAAADCYDDPPLAFWDRFGRRTVERLSLRRGAHVLDLCCGSGASALVAAERVGPSGRVLGLDVADRLLAVAGSKAGARGLEHARFEHGDLTSVDDRVGSFDAVVCVFGIFFVPDMVAALRRLWERVGPEGVLAVTTWGPRLFEPGNSAFWDAVRAEAPGLYKGFNPWERIESPAGLRALFDDAGIGAVEIEAEAGSQPITSPADWWTIVLGSGYRGTVEQLPPEARERVRLASIGRMEADAVRAVETNVLYAVARRGSG